MKSTRPRPAAVRSRVRAVLASVVLLAVVPSATAGPMGAAQPAPAVAVDGADGIGDPYWPKDGNGGYDVLRYRVRNDWSFDRRRLRGSTVVTLRARKDLRSLSLDFLLPVRSVSVGGAPADFRRTGAHEVRVTPRRPLRAGTTYAVRVAYAGVPSRYSYAGENAWLESRDEVVAMGQPHMAPWWFPANDHPRDKAFVDVTTTVPRGTQVVGNGRLVSRVRTGGKVSWRWRADEPMAPYLAFFAAGKFDLERGSTDGLRWTNAISRRLPVSQRRAALAEMRRSAPVVRWLEKDLGPYPFSVTGGVVTSVPAGFALENQTRPTYPWAPGQMRLLMVHELAHQWFGDHVALAGWRDIWLNEGFATFMEWRWSETHGGWSADRELRTTYDAFGPREPLWDVVVADPGAGRIFDWAVYTRGAMTLQALRNRVGEATFFEILRTWAQTHPTGNATSAEFEALAESISGEDLGGFFDAWLRTPLRPADTAANGLG